VVVESVEGKSPAEAAGLKPGDVIAAVGDVKVERSLDFYRPSWSLARGPACGDGPRGEEKLSASLPWPPPRPRQAGHGPTWSFSDWS